MSVVDFFYSLTIGALFAIGVFQLLRRDLIKAVMGFSLLFTGVNLFLLASGAFEGVADRIRLTLKQAHKPVTRLYRHLS
jgi:multisubunit Na+/H+ antiporter MnhC subunit